MATREPPPGLHIGLVSLPITKAAEEEARALFESERHSNSGGSDVIEIQWSHIAGEKHRRWQMGVPASQCPSLCSFMDAAMRDLSSESSGLLERGLGNGFVGLNVILRKCARGQAIKFHVDNKDYDEPVFVGVLYRTPDSKVLQFRTPDGDGSWPSQRYDVPEVAGRVLLSTGDSRWTWQHGLHRMESGERISLAWRWFRRDMKLRCPLDQDAEEIAKVGRSSNSSASTIVRREPTESSSSQPALPLSKKVPAPPLKHTASGNAKLGYAFADFSAIEFGGGYMSLSAGDLLELVHESEEWGFGTRLLCLGDSLHPVGRGWFPLGHWREIDCTRPKDHAIRAAKKKRK